QLEPLAAKRDRRVMLDVEEVGALQVRVARRLAAPQAARVDRDLEGRGGRVVRVEVERAMNVLEVPADAGDHHVPRAELRRRVPRLEEPLRHTALLRGGKATRKLRPPRGLRL